ncbi:chaperonin [Culex quinquefasciatus]|uniref:Chaperonin n=1 Tax=Culex quinquefasciatus TaxID=7176 RepID=B0WAJ8_CULQU|nr:chaperonin [Culex quinquefasciatus]|eukprot:XP_001845732.1 chaperonin [Culex quinquefasciatus]
MAGKVCSGVNAGSTIHRARRTAFGFCPDCDLPQRIAETFAEEEEGEIARLSSFVGAIGDLIKSTLGPKGMDMGMIQMAHGRSAGQVEVTIDGATILKAVCTIRRIIVNMSRFQDDEVGDGSTYVTVLASELLREPEKLIEQKLHPQTIIAGWRAATQAARSALIAAAQDNLTDAEKFREDMMNIAWTTLSSRIRSQQKEYFAKLVVGAVMRLKGLNAILRIKKTGSCFEDSFLDEGFLLDKKPDRHQSKRIENAMILVANTPMDTDKIQVIGSSIKMDSMANIAELEVAEKEKMTDKVTTRTRFVPAVAI